MKSNSRVTEEEVMLAIGVLAKHSEEELISQIKSLDENLEALEAAKIVSFSTHNKVLQTRRLLALVLEHRRTGTASVDG